jgi:leucyl-tRNA synthetase
MSKSARNIIPLRNIVEEYGPDIVRLLIALGAEVHQDENIDYDSMEKLCKHEYPQILMSIHDLAVKLYNEKDILRDEVSTIDSLFWNEFVYKVKKVVELLNNVKIREAGIMIFYDIKRLINEYIDLVKIPSKLILEVLRIWIPLISVYTPFIAEEIWSKTFKEGFASTYVIKIPREVDLKAVLALRYAEALVESIQNIVRATKRAAMNNITLYIASRDQQKLMRKVLELYRQNMKLGDIISSLSEQLGVGKRELVQIVKQLYDVVTNTLEELASLYTKLADIDELEIAKLAADYLSKVLGVRIDVYSVEDTAIPDKGGKKKSALPLRPGVYIE